MLEVVRHDKNKKTYTFGMESPEEKSDFIKTVKEFKSRSSRIDMLTAKLNFSSENSPPDLAVWEKEFQESNSIRHSYPAREPGYDTMVIMTEKEEEEEEEEEQVNDQSGPAASPPNQISLAKNDPIKIETKSSTENHPTTSSPINSKTGTTGGTDDSNTLTRSRSDPSTKEGNKDEGNPNNDGTESFTSRPPSKTIIPFISRARKLHTRENRSNAKSVIVLQDAFYSHFVKEMVDHMKECLPAKEKALDRLSYEVVPESCFSGWNTHL